MKKPLHLLTLAALLPLTNAHLVASPLDTAFTYQGRLADGGNAANGTYDLKFDLYEALTSGTRVGSSLTNAAVALSNGCFTVTLDFGAAFTGNAYWLEMGVRTNGGDAFTTLTPRQPLTPAPYALYAPRAGTAATATTAASANSVAAASITGTLGLGQLPGAVVTNNETGVTLGGIFTGSGAGLTSVNADQLDGQHAAFYQNAANLTSGTLADARLSGNIALRSTTNTFTSTNVFTKPVGIDCYNPGQPLQVGNANTFGSQGMIRLASRSTNSAQNRIWDIGVPQTGSDLSGMGYSFVIDDTQLGTDPEFIVHWGTGRVGIGRNDPATALDVNGTVTATNFSGSGAGLTGVNADLLDGQHGAFYQNAANLNAGTIALAQLPGAVVTNNATGLNLSGTFAGNGAGVTNVNLLTANSQGAIGWATNYGSFVLASAPSVGATPYSVVAADVNVDGKLDLISANSYASTVTVLTNNGTGTFLVSGTVPVGSAPAWVTAADVNGNGRVDLITANSGNNTLTVLTNNGSGRFVLSTTLTVGTNPYTVVAADVNSDGRLDLISANKEANSLSVLTNGGSSGFALAATLPVGSNPYSVAAADVNGDGKVDLISANFGHNSLSVLTNNGTGSFIFSASVPVGMFPISVTAADVNGDAKIDLIAANSSGSSLSVVTNNGIGGFAAAATVAVDLGPWSVAAADLTGDGKVDLVSANYAAGGGNTLSLLTNNGSGGFAIGATLAVGSAPHAVTTADLNEDGRLDLISADAGPSTLSILFNHASSYVGNFTGSGAGLIGLNAANLTGTAGSFSATNLHVFGTIAGNGSSLSNLNASQLTSGTLPLAQLPAAAVTNNATGVTLAGTFSGNGAGLTNLSATNLTGTIADARLSTNVPLLNANQAFTGSNRFAGVLALTNAANAFAGTFNGNGAALSNLNASHLAGGTVPLAVLPGDVVTNNETGLILTGAFSGNGAGLTNLSATTLTGTIADARLSSNVALLNANQAFTGSNRFAGVIALTNTANAFAGTFTGNGAGLVNLNAAVLTGTVADGQLSPNVALLNSNQSFTGLNRFAGVVTLTNAANALAGAFTGSSAGTFTGSSVGTFTGSGGGLTNVPGAVPWVTVAGTSQAAAPRQAYLLTNNALVTVMLPAAPVLGDVVRVSSAGARGWKIAQNSGQMILAGNIPGNPVGVNWTARPVNGMWVAAASSGDGSTLMAAFNSGPIYISTDSGATWMPRASGRTWSSLAASADGTKLVGVVRVGQIYTSSDSGVTWTARASSQLWSSVASSADGTKLVATVAGSQIYTSRDSGVTWTPHGVSLSWNSVASSADGTKLVAVPGNGQIYTSSDSGTNWTARANSQYWFSVASSADGTKLVAAVLPGPIYTSSDSGTNWTARTSNLNWECVASSADGTKLVGVTWNGPIYTSSDSGVTWTPHAGNRNWQCVASSSDGNRLVAGVNGGYIYTSVPGTTVGTGGYLTGAQYEAVELQYVGNGQFIPLSHEGNILAY